nr:hypothetical protein [Tanacetum cinerariifolium]
MLSRKDKRARLHTRTRKDSQQQVEDVLQMGLNHSDNEEVLVSSQTECVRANERSLSRLGIKKTQRWTCTDKNGIVSCLLL